MRHRLLLVLTWLVLLNLTISFTSFTSLVKADTTNKCGVNVGPYYGQIDRVKQMTKEGGWIVALGTLGDCNKASSLFGNGLNVVFRSYNAAQEFTEDQAIAWTATLGKLDSKGQMIFLMPWNEPNHENEGGGPNAGLQSYQYVEALKRNLAEAGLLNTKVTLLSPQVDKLNPSFINGSFFNNPGGKTGYYRLASGSSINEYDLFQPTACTASLAPQNNCQYQESKTGIPGPYYALEAGVVNGCTPPCYKDSELKQMLDESWKVWGSDSAFKMFAIFSYDPHHEGAWDIFGANQVKSFYQNTCQAGSIIPASPNDQAQFENWLASVSDKLVECNECGYAPIDKKGLCTAVGAESPQGSKSSPYDLSIYDDYDVNNQKFYLHPILKIGSSNMNDSPAIRDDLINQGYQAFCATPRYLIGTTLGPSAIVESFLKHYSNANLTFGSEQKLDYSTAETPLWRNLTDKQYLFSSIEEFFGFKDSKIQDSSQAEIRSAPVNSLLSSNQRCQQSLKMLKDVDYFCKRLTNPNACALYDQKIPDSNFTFRSLFEKTSQLPQGPIKENESLCNFWIKKYGKDDQQIKDIVNALYLTPLYLNRAYRTAFLVVAIDQVPKKTNRLLSFFHVNNSDQSHNQEAFAVGFKVPDFGTNPGTNEGSSGGGSNLSSSSYPDWDDALDLTRNSLLTTQQKQDQKKKRLNFIDQLRSAANTFADQLAHTNQLKIFCSAGTPDPCDNSPITKALVDIINGQAAKPELASKMFCQQPTTEDSQYLKDDASIDPNPEDQLRFANLFGKDYGPQLIKSILPPDIAEQAKYVSSLDVNRNTYRNRGETFIDFYLVYPVGLSLESVESALSGTFFTQHELKSLNLGDPYKREGFKMQSVDQEFNSESKDYSFDDPNHCTLQIDPDGNKYLDCKKTFTASLEEPIEKPARILGGGLGYWTRIIQLNLHDLLSKARKYLATCKTTEEFLTASCSGEDVAPKYWPLNPKVRTIGPYCNVLQDVITDDSANFQICQTADLGGHCKNPLPRQSSDYFVDPSSDLTIKLRSSILDGATLLLTGAKSPNNPAQSLSNRCGSGDSTYMEIWRLPPDYPSSKLDSYDNWRNDSTKLKYQPVKTDSQLPDSWVNGELTLPVKAGYYKIFIYDTGCFMGATAYIDATGGGMGKMEKQNYFLLSDTKLGQKNYCADVIVNSNMPGQSALVSSIPHCDQPLPTPYDTSLNMACGGLHGSMTNPEINQWTNVAQSAIGKSSYEQIFHRNFLPIRDISGDSRINCEDLFPNVVAKVDCSSLSF